LIVKRLAPDQLDVSVTRSGLIRLLWYGHRWFIAEATETSFTVPAGYTRICVATESSSLNLGSRTSSGRASGVSKDVPDGALADLMMLGNQIDTVTVHRGPHNLAFQTWQLLSKRGILLQVFDQVCHSFI
jgi:hypothetical protein